LSPLPLAALRAIEVDVGFSGMMIIQQYAGQTAIFKFLSSKPSDGFAYRFLSFLAKSSPQYFLLETALPHIDCITKKLLTCRTVHISFTASIQ
jgi:hypothetical protein